MIVQLTATERSARVEHQCWWCHETIFPAEIYLDERYAADGRAYSLALHMECATACSIHFRDNGPDYEYTAELLSPPYPRGKTPYDAEETL